MRNNIFFTVAFLLLSIISCAPNKVLKNTLTKEWIIDSIGCMDLRAPIAYKLYSDKKLLIDNRYSSLKSLFGDANSTYEKADNTYYYYFISCALQPPINGRANFVRKYSKEIECFIIVANKNDIIIDCKIIKP